MDDSVEVLRRNRTFRASQRLPVGACCLLLTLAAASAQPHPQSAQPGASPVVPVQILYLARGGCQQAVIHRKAAEFLLFVVNLSGHPVSRLCCTPRTAPPRRRKNFQARSGIGCRI